MKAAVVHALDDIRVVDMPIPAIGHGEILVRMKAVGLCGSDTTPWYVARKAPAVLGHETAGVIERVGDGVPALSPGDRVFVHHHAPCGTCKRCARGDAVLCADWKPVRLHPGGLAEFVRVEAASVLRDTLVLPLELDFEDGALVEPVACAVKAVARGGIRPGDSVLVLGLGSNGLLLGLLARHAGAARLLGSDPDPRRRLLSLGFGFDEAFDPAEVRLADAICSGAAEKGSDGADVVFVIPTAPSAALSALEAAAPGGRVVFYSPVAPEAVWPVAPHDPYFRDLTLRFSYSCGPAETREALDLLAKGVVKAARLVTHRRPLAEAPEAFRLAVAGGEVLKVMVRM